MEMKEDGTEKKKAGLKNNLIHKYVQFDKLCFTVTIVIFFQQGSRGRGGGGR